MEIIKLPSALLVLLLLASCASTGSNRLSTEYSASDDLANKRFVLQFHNNGRRLLCLSSATWPNVVGNIPLTSADISVSIRQKVFPLDTFIEDCRDCTFTVKPHSRLVGYLNYSAFKIPDELAGDYKEPHLLPMAVSCD